MKNNIVLKRIAVITLVLFSLFIMVDFVPDSDAKRPPPKKEKPAPKPLPEDTADVPLPEIDIPLDSGSCESKATGEVSGGVKAKTETKVTPPKSGSGSCGCDSSGGCTSKKGSIEVSGSAKITGDNGVDSVETTVTGKVSVGSDGSATAEVEAKWTLKWKRK